MDSCQLINLAIQQYMAKALIGRTSAETGAELIGVLTKALAYAILLSCRGKADAIGKSTEAILQSLPEMIAEIHNHIESGLRKQSR